MSEPEKSTPTDSPAPTEPFDPEVSIFREVALLHLPSEWRPALRQLGVWLFDWSLERWGIANEAPDTLSQTGARMKAIAADLKSAREMLWGLASEAGQTEMTEAELRLCRVAGKLAPKAGEVARDLIRATLGPERGE